MIPWQSGIEVFTFFVDDLRRSKSFYRDQFGLPVAYEDRDSVVFECGNLSINLVERPDTFDRRGRIGSPLTESVRHVQITIDVADLDSACADLSRRGVSLLSEPADRAGGFRNATFMDPDGYVWEVAQQLSQARGITTLDVEVPAPGLPAKPLSPPLAARIA